MANKAGIKREVIEYYMAMVGLWQELDLSLEEKWESLGDSIRYKRNSRTKGFMSSLSI